MKVETRAVLAGAYWHTALPATSMLTHAVELDDDGTPLRVLGKRCVILANLADAASLDPAERAKLPTCRRCKAKDPRAKATNTEARAR